MPIEIQSQHTVNTEAVAASLSYDGTLSELDILSTTVKVKYTLPGAASAGNAKFKISIYKGTTDPTTTPVVTLEIDPKNTNARTGYATLTSLTSNFQQGDWIIMLFAGTANNTIAADARWARGAQKGEDVSWVEMRNYRALEGGKGRMTIAYNTPKITEAPTQQLWAILYKGLDTNGVDIGKSTSIPYGNDVIFVDCTALDKGSQYTICLNPGPDTKHYSASYIFTYNPT